MPAQARLLWPVTVDIKQPRRADIVMDEDFREPGETDQEIFLKSIPVSVLAQVNFNQFEDQTMGFTGDDETVRGYLIISEQDQERYRFRVNDYIVGIRSRNRISQTAYRITQVRPRAQKAHAFGLYRLDFKEDSKA